MKLDITTVALHARGVSKTCVTQKEITFESYRLKICVVIYLNYFRFLNSLFYSIALLFAANTKNELKTKDLNYDFCNQLSGVEITSLMQII